MFIWEIFKAVVCVTANHHSAYRTSADISTRAENSRNVTPAERMMAAYDYVVTLLPDALLKMDCKLFRVQL